VLRLPPLTFLNAIVELKTLEFEVEFILNELLDSLYVYLVEFGDNASADETMLESESHLFAI
jgi:hypothetical protein